MHDRQLVPGIKQLREECLAANQALYVARTE